MEQEEGLMTSWSQVYRGNISVSVPYMVCTIFWIVGVLAVLLFIIWKQCEFNRELKDSVLLFDRVYQSDKLSVPVRTGIFRGKIYLPGQLSAKEMKNIVLNQQLHQRRGDDLLTWILTGICCIHWWNPCIWLMWYLFRFDLETACDEAVVRKIGWAQKGIYAQDTINMKKDGNGLSVPVSAFQETHMQRRAEHLLYIEPVSVWKKSLAAFFLSVCFFCWFGLSAIHTSWNGGAWRPSVSEKKETAFSKKTEEGITNEVLARCETQTPEGRTVWLELMMTQGVWKKGEGYQGQCMLRMLDEENTSIASLSLSKVFAGENTQHFDENIQLSVDDYNEDGTMELSLGQQMEKSPEELAAPATAAALETGETEKSLEEQEEGQQKSEESSRLGENQTVYGYYLINIEEDALSVASDPIYWSEVTALQTGSMIFSYIQGAGGIITTQLNGEMAYYVWEQDKKRYIRQTITQQEIDERRKEQTGKNMLGQDNEYALKNSQDQVVMVVETQTDETGGQRIKKVSMNPSGKVGETGTRQESDIEGYFYELAWAAGEGAAQDQYAVLTYTGETGQAFVLYDVQKKKSVYTQTDEIKQLAEIFQQYQEEEITFDQKGAVVYHLSEIVENDVLKISFAANADHDRIVRGSYLYQISNNKAYNFQYERELDTDS